MGQFTWDYSVDGYYLNGRQAFGTVHKGWSSAYTEYLAAKSRSDIGRIVVADYDSGRIIEHITPLGPTAPLQGNAESPSSSDLNATGAITRPPE